MVTFLSGRSVITPVKSGSHQLDEKPVADICSAHRGSPASNAVAFAQATDCATRPDRASSGPSSEGLLCTWRPSPLSTSPGVVDFATVLALSAFTPVLSVAVHSPLRSTKGSSLPPVGILRLAETPITRSENKIALSFQPHTGLPTLQPDVAMLCWE